MLFKKNSIYFKTTSLGSDIKLFIAGISGLFLAFYMLLNPMETLNSAKTGLILWYKSVVPSLLPFLIITDVVVNTNIVYYLGKLASPIMGIAFNQPGESSAAVILGLISGYPVGAKICCDLYNNSSCNRNEAQRLLCFANNCGPMFILGTTAIGIYGIKEAGPLLLFCHYAGSLTNGIILRFARLRTIKKKVQKKGNNISNGFTIGNIISRSIEKSTALIISIGGFIVLFSVVIAIIKKLIPIHDSLLYSTIIGSIEMTNGVNNINLLNCSLYIKMIISSFIIGFGGISVVLQTVTVIKSTDLNINYYIISKLCHGIFSAAYCAIFYGCFIKENATAAFTTNYSLSYNNIGPLSILNLVCTIIILFSVLLTIKNKFKAIKK